MNRIRGEVPLVVGGATYRLCLTLGALAEIETHLGAGNLAELDARLARPTTADLVAILGALLRGGGHTLGDDEVAAFPVDLGAMIAAITAAFAAAGLSDGDTDHEPGEGHD